MTHQEEEEKKNPWRCSECKAVVDVEDLLFKGKEHDCTPQRDEEHKGEWEERFEAEFMEYATENENTLIDSDTDGERVKKFIRSLLQSKAEELLREVEGRMEKYADFEHVRWAKWQNYLHSHLTWNNEIQAWVLPHEWKDRWQMQINKPYSMLSEKEKESDREQVRPYLTDIEHLIRTVLEKK